MDKKRKFKSICIQFLAAAVVLTSFNGSVRAVDVTGQSTVTLTRKDVALMAVSNSSVIRSLGSGLEDMQSGYSDMIEGIKGLNTLYNEVLPRYKNLYDKNEVTLGNPNYSSYLNLQISMITDLPRLAAIAARLAVLTSVGDPNLTAQAVLDEIASLNIEKGQIDIRVASLNTLQTNVLSTQDISKVITVSEYYELQALAAQFAFMGITSPNLTPQQEYDTFIYPLKVAPVSLESGIVSMLLGIESAKAGIGFGARQLYDALLMMYSYYELQAASLTLTEKDYTVISNKFKRGLVSQYDLTKAKNAYDIATLEKTKMERDINNMEMSLKNMLGLKLMVKIKLLDDIDTSLKLNTLEYYLQQAAKNRSEIKGKQSILHDLENQMDYSKKYSSNLDDNYSIVKIELANGQIDLKEVQLSIEKEIRKAYADVLGKEADMRVKQLEAENSKKSLNNLQQYLSLGFVTEAAVNGIKVMSLQADGAYQTAQRSYYSALNAIEAASGIGPAYSLDGGISLEK